MDVNIGEVLGEGLILEIMAKVALFVVGLCFSLCESAPAGSCSGGDVEQTVDVLKSLSVDDFDELAGWLDLRDKARSIEEYCASFRRRKIVECCYREFVDMYCRGKGLHETLHDLADVLEHQMGHKRQAKELLKYSTAGNTAQLHHVSSSWTLYWLGWLVFVVAVAVFIFFLWKYKRSLLRRKNMLIFLVTVGVINIVINAQLFPMDGKDVPPTVPSTAHYFPTSPTLSIHLEKQLPPVVSKYAEYLRAKYDNILGSIPDKLPFTLGNEYVRLTIVKNEIDTHAKADIFHQKYRGNVNMILDQKEEIEVKDIFKPGEKTRFILIEGEPGIGKSTLGVELCHQWQNHSLLQQFSLVVLLRLREESVRSATNIKDFFFHPEEIFRGQLVDEIKKSMGKNVLLIFDGFDEFPRELRKKSLIMDMIKGTEYLTEATILVTSRPSALADLQPLLRSTSSKHIEIVGFTDDSIDKAASKVFDNPELFSNFSAYLSANPVVKAIMYNPLNSAIVLNMYRQNFKTGRPIPHTLTQLYTELSRSLISSYLNGIEHLLAKALPENLKDLPKDLYFQLLEISELAYNGTVTDDKEIFETLPENCSGLGLLIEYRSLFSVSEIVQYTFFHKSLQEYMSAFYISQQEVVKQREFINMSFCSQKSIVNFVAGLTKLKDVGWDKIISFVCTKDFEYNPLPFTCFYEAHILENCCGFIDDKKREIFGSLTEYEMYALGYTISSCGKSWKLSVVDRTVSRLQMLVYGLKYNESSTGSIQTLDLYPTEGEIMKYLSLLPQFILQNIELLSLDRCELVHEEFQRLALCIPQLSSLKTLIIRANPGGPGSLVDLMKSLKTHTRIEYLSMDSMNIGMEDVTAVSNLIKSSNSLKWLKVDYGIPCLPYEKYPYIQEELVKIVLSPSYLVNVEIVFDFKHGVNMKGVDLISNKLESLTLNGHRLQNKNCTFIDEQLWRLLTENKSLKQLTFKLTLCHQDIEKMIQWLEENDSLETLQLSEDNKQSLMPGSQKKALDTRIEFVYLTIDILLYNEEQTVIIPH